jgi:hypothetical protein
VLDPFGTHESFGHHNNAETMPSCAPSSAASASSTSSNR